MLTCGRNCSLKQFLGGRGGNEGGRSISVPRQPLSAAPEEQMWERLSPLRAPRLCLRRAPAMQINACCHGSGRRSGCPTLARRCGGYKHVHFHPGESCENTSEPMNSLESGALMKHETRCGGEETSCFWQPRPCLKIPTEILACRGRRPRSWDQQPRGLGCTLAHICAHLAACVFVYVDVTPLRGGVSWLHATFGFPVLQGTQ